MPLNRPRLAMVALLAAVLLAIPASAAAVTPEEFIAEADRICEAKSKPAGKELAKGLKQIQKGNLNAGGRSYSRGGSKLLKAINRVGALPRPADSFSGALDDWLKFSRKGALGIMDFGRAVSRGQVKKLRKIERRIDEIVQKSERAANQIGFREC